MESGDGLLLRVRPRGAALSADALTAIAEVSERFGNGRIDLTRRANLQIRGVRNDTLDAAQAQLAEAGLLDGDSGLEAVRNVLLSPLAGLDPKASAQAAPLAQAIERGLAEDATFQALPAKFSFLIDAGGRLPLGDVAADIRIELDGAQARLSLGGDAAQAAPVAVLPVAKAADAALDLARAFLRMRADAAARTIRDLLTAVGAKALASTAGLPPVSALAFKGRSTLAKRADIFGRHAGYLGLGAAFGSFDAAQLRALGELSGDGVRVTPWRALLVPNPSAGFETAIEPLGFVTRADDPRLAVAACPGHPACLSGEVATRPIAEALAGALALHRHDGIALHVSGCAKGCALSGAAPFTLVGHEGRFDLVLDGRARDAAVLSGLNAAQAESAIALAMRQALAS